MNIKSNLKVSKEKLNAEIKTAFKSPDTELRTNQSISLEGDFNIALEFKKKDFNFDENYDGVDDKNNKDSILSISKSVKKKQNYEKERTDNNCKICSLNFQSYNQLKFHRRKTHPSHLNKVLCDVCGKVFSSIGIKNTHMKTMHSVTKPYACDQCDKSFSTAGIRKTHMNNRHSNSEDGALQLPCEECGKMFRHAGSLNTHIEHVHKSWQPSPCPQCGKLVRYMRNHMKHKHSTVK